VENLQADSERLVPHMPLKTIIPPYSEPFWRVQSWIISKNL